MKSKDKWSLIRVGLGDYAIGKSQYLDKEVLKIAKINGALSANIFKSTDGFLVKGDLPVVRLFGSQDKSQALIIEILLEERLKDVVLTSIKKLLETIDDPVVIYVVKSDIEVYGL